jgi:molecular chaperone DnaK (HSP70)
MAKVGAQRAAELTGKSKSTIQRAMKAGKISFELDTNNRRVIDVSELERAFGLQSATIDSNSGQTPETVENRMRDVEQMLEYERMRMRIKMLEDQVHNLEQQLEDMREQRDQWQKQSQQVLLTSQYSQQQAEAYREELKQREEKARQRRQQKLNQNMQHLEGGNRNTNRQAQSSPKEQQSVRVQAQNEDTHSGAQQLWHRIKEKVSRVA